MKIKKKIILIGAGGHGVSCSDVIEKENKYQIYGFIDKKIFFLSEYKIIGSDADLIKIRKNVKNALITIGQIKNLFLREKIFKKLIKLKFNFPVVISPLAYVSKNASIGEGTIIMHQALVNAKAKIGKNCIINTGAIIEHDVTIEDNCHISTGSIINGGAIIKRNSFIGSGAVIKQNIKIGKASMVNAKKFIEKNLKNNSKIL
jgi:sugar O-acyltransferase (sialic acid O-acetyltransferase NeuD family)